jgi:hypothetical protein
MLRRASLSLFAGLLVVASANAATVQLEMVTSGNNWQLFAHDSLGDNGGIASYNIPFLNISTLTNEGPYYQANTTDFQPAGFSELRLPATDNDPVGKTAFASQKLVPTPTTHVVYGFGQVAGSLPGAFFGASKQVNYGAPLLLASGTWAGTGAAPDVDYNPDGVLSINVFQQSGQTATAAATVEPFAVIPEPATLSLFGLAMVGCFGLIRRRSA